jgi:hypothetical protein
VSKRRALRPQWPPKQYSQASNMYQAATRMIHPQKNERYHYESPRKFSGLRGSAVHRTKSNRAKCLSSSSKSKPFAIRQGLGQTMVSAGTPHTRCSWTLGGHSADSRLGGRLGIIDARSQWLVRRWNQLSQLAPSSLRTGLYTCCHWSSCLR